MYKANDGTHERQVWYDDPVSLGIKFTFARSQEMRGVAFWNIDSLCYELVSDQLPQSTEKMWQAIDVFLQQQQPS